MYLIPKKTWRSLWSRSWMSRRFPPQFGPSRKRIRRHSVSTATGHANWTTRKVSWRLHREVRKSISGSSNKNRLEFTFASKGWQECEQRPNSACVLLEAEECERASEGQGILEGIQRLSGDRCRPCFRGRLVRRVMSRPS